MNKKLTLGGLVVYDTRAVRQAIGGVHLRGFDTAILVALIPLELQPLSGRLFVIVVELYKQPRSLRSPRYGPQ